MHLLSIIYFVILVISFLISSTIFFDKGAPLYLKLFPAFLGITLTIETISHAMYTMHIDSRPVYNFFTVFEFVFYFWVLQHIINHGKIKRVISISIRVYPLIALTNILFFQGIHRFHTYTLILGALLIVTFCVAYFYNLIKFPVSERPVRNPSFYICCGLLFFYSATLPIMAAINLHLYTQAFKTNILHSLLLIINHVFYSLFAIAFLIRRRWSKV